MNITRGKIPCAKKVVVYGPEGIGKSTFAAQFPDPVFIDTEGSTNDMDVARFPAPSSWQMLLSEVAYARDNPSTCKTLIIDTADWAEQLCVVDICNKYKKSGIEDFGYGKGYIFLQEEFGRLLNLLTELTKEKNIHVVIIAHAKMRKFEQPDEMGAYDRWEMKLSKQIGPLVKEWADMVLFANYKTHVVKVDGKNKVQGGDRVMYTTHHSCWDAKNRYGLDDMLPFSYASIAHIMQTAEKQDMQPPKSKASTQPPAPVGSATKSAEKPAKKEASEVPAGEQMSLPLEQTAQPACAAETVGYKEPDIRIPKALRDLMIADKVDEWNLQNICEAKGYVPAGTPIWEYDTVNPGIVEGLLVPCWPQVYIQIKTMLENEEIPFN